MCHIRSERDCSGKPSALEVKPGINGYFGAGGEQTDAKVVSNADFGFVGTGTLSCCNDSQQSSSCSPA